MGIYRVIRELMGRRRKPEPTLMGYQQAGRRFDSIARDEDSRRYLKDWLVKCFFYTEESAERVMNGFQANGSLDREKLFEEGITLTSPDGIEIYHFIKRTEKTWEVECLAPEKPVMKAWI